MARNRMIKPEFWEDEIVAECKFEARLFFISLWNFADDEGFVELKEKWLKAKCFPYDNVDILGMLQELSGKGRIKVKNNIIQILHFKDHQRIDKPKPSDLKEKFNISENIPRTILECSTTKIEEKGKEIEREIEIKIKEEKNTSSEKNFLNDSIEIELSNLLFELIRKNNPKAKIPNFQKWAAEVDKMIRLDSRTIQEIEFIIRFSQEDNFWKANILSTSKLREKFDQLFVKAKSLWEKQKAEKEKLTIPSF